MPYINLLDHNYISNFIYLLVFSVPTIVSTPVGHRQVTFNTEIPKFTLNEYYLQIMILRLIKFQSKRNIIYKYYLIINLILFNNI